MPYFPKSRVVLLHVPKTGGTSVEDYFFNREGIRNRAWHHLFGTFRSNRLRHSLQHCTYLELLEHGREFGLDLRRKDLLVVAIVRNPYDRAVSSLFYQKLVTEHSTQAQVHAALRKFLESPEPFDNHKLPQLRFVCDADGSVLPSIVLLRTESLTAGMRTLGYDDFDKKNNVNPSKQGLHAPTFLGSEAIRLVNEYYACDFDAFGYERM